MRLDLLKRLTTAVLALALLASAAAAPAQNPAEQGAWDTAENLVAEIYDEVSFEAGKVPDWEKVRAMFIPEAVVVLRTSREATTVFSVDGFINDFVNFVENTPAGANGFTEKVLNLKSMVFGEMGHVLVLYEAQITGSQRPPSQGVDSFSLIKKDGRWWIVAITNEIPGPDRPVPEMLLN